MNEREPEVDECPCCRWMKEELGVLDMEPAEYLAGRGTMLPDPATVADEQIHFVLWTAIEAMSGIRIFLECTDHLSDRELYERLYRSLHSPLFFSPDDPWSSAHIDYSGGGGEDFETFLRYYADDAVRESWKREFPDDAMPPHETPPYDRDALLPQPYANGFAKEEES